jgi:hypothetical protein
MTRDARAALAALVAVVVVVILGFRFLGSPRRQRLMQSDLRTVGALSQLAQQIQQKSLASGHEIPANLDSFPDAAKRDPVSRQSFLYRPRSKTSYELCATFVAKSPDVEPNTSLPNEGFWAHPAGDYCFSFDATGPVPPAPYVY